MNTPTRLARFLTLGLAVLGLCVLAPAAVRAQSVAWAQSQAVTGPSLPYQSAIAYDSARGVTVYFGNDSPVPGSTSEWNGTIWTHRTVSGPPALSQHAMAYDSVRHVTVLFGGGTGNGGSSGVPGWLCSLSTLPRSSPCSRCP